MIDALYLPPKPAIIRVGEPWEIRAHADMAAHGIPRHIRRAILAELKRIVGVRSRAIQQATLDDLAAYAGVPDLRKPLAAGLLLNPYILAAAGPVVIGAHTDTTAVEGAFATWTAANIGTASANRIVLVLLMGNITSLTGLSCTIGGNAATKLVSQESQAVVAIFALLVTSETTANIIFAKTGGTVNRWAAAVNIMTGTGGATTASSTSTTNGGSLTIPSNGGAIACAVENSPSGSDWTWTNLTEDVDAVQAGGPMPYSTAYSTTGGTANRTATPPASGATHGFCMAAFAPG